MQPLEQISVLEKQVSQLQLENQQMKFNLSKVCNAVPFLKKLRSKWFIGAKIKDIIDALIAMFATVCPNTDTDGQK